MRHLIWMIIAVQILLFCPIEKVLGHEEPFQEKPGSNAEIEVEYLSPLHGNRQIDTVSLNSFHMQWSSSSYPLSFSWGETLTYAWGNTIWPNALGQEVTCDNSVVGIGPVIQYRYEPFQWERWSFSLDISGGLIFYSDNFPEGGDFYNFMWRIGPKLTYVINRQYALSIGYKWMHVSNGQNSSHNPGYDSKGVSIGIRKRF